MKKTIKLTLLKPLIFESVKNETFLKGNIDKSIDPKAVELAYHEQAGDEEYQERMLERGFHTALEDLKTHLSEYIPPVSYYMDNGENIDAITLHLSVSSRFNDAYADSLSVLCSKFIEESMLVDWWKPINEKQSTLYAQFVERDLTSIKRSFVMTAPVAPSSPYTSYIRTTGTSIELSPREHATITYNISEGAIDDILCRVEDHHLIDVRRSHEGFVLVGKHRGHTYIELYSRHDPEIKCILHVFITDHK